MRTLLFLALTLFFSFVEASEVKVRAVKGSWSDFQTDSELVRLGLEQMINSSYLRNLQMPIDVYSLPSDSLQGLRASGCVSQLADDSWVFEAVSTECVFALPYERRDTVFRFVLEQFDNVYPSYGTTVLSGQDLKDQMYMQIQHPNINLDSDIDAKELLSPLTSKVLWQMSKKKENCVGSALAAIAVETEPFYSDDMTGETYKSYFQLINDDQDWQFGDLITFEIPLDGHAMVYVGTDEETGQKIVFTKNGFLRSPFQLSSYESVYKVYESFGILKINHYRVNQSFKMPTWQIWSENSELDEVESIDSIYFRSYLQSLPKSAIPTL